MHSKPGSPNNNRIYDGMEHLILCEGMDEWKFITEYLNSKAVADYPEISQKIQVENFGGNEELPIKLQLWIKAPGFDHIKTLVVIRDAEKNAEQAVGNIISAMNKAQLHCPNQPGKLEHGEKLTTGFLLFPTLSADLIDGTLEDLCISILKESEKETLWEIEDFLNHLEERSLRFFTWKFKTKLHTFFSVTNEYVSLKIGEAATAGAFDWYSPCLQEFKTFLLEMIK